MALHDRLKGELMIPHAAATDPQAIELARIWATEGAQHVSLATGIWDDPAAWGMMLVDLAHHIANAYAETDGRSATDVLARIRVGFDTEWDNPTDTPTGNLPS